MYPIVDGPVGSYRVAPGDDGDADPDRVRTDHASPEEVLKQGCSVSHLTRGTGAIHDRRDSEPFGCIASCDYLSTDPGPNAIHSSDVSRPDDKAP